MATGSTGEAVTSRSRSAGLRLTKVGLGFFVLAAILALAAINTGNNSLYLVLAVMVGLLVVSNGVAAINVRGLGFSVDVPDEVFVNRPAHVAIDVVHRGRWWPRALLVAELGATRATGTRRRVLPALIGTLRARDQTRAEIELLPRRRGPWRLDHIAVSSLYPLGFFHKLRRYPLVVELLVYPEIFSAPASQPMRSGRQGDESTPRRGMAAGLIEVRDFRPGDDPRAIHWKHTARTGRLMYKEREAEESRRLSIVFDNAVGPLPDEDAQTRFERLVSEAATAAVDMLARGFEVEMHTRDAHLGFGVGWRQRRAILEALARIQPQPRVAHPLHAGSAPGPVLRLAMDPVDAAQASQAS